MGCELVFTGTGDARGTPVWGCGCRSCLQTVDYPSRIRRACSAELVADGFRLLIDAGRADLTQRYNPGEINAILLTHFHMDHVMGLFHLRWGTGQTIPVHRPDDPEGCDDLYKHPGILDFRPPARSFESFELGPFTVTPLPLIHSKPTLGYAFAYGEGNEKRLVLAYLTDTIGLPDETLNWLCRHKVKLLVLDCSLPPQPTAPRNHNDLDIALSLIDQIRPERSLLTHLGHTIDDYLLDHPLRRHSLLAGADAPQVELAADSMRVQL